MPKPKQHQEKAEHNRAFLNSICATGPADWIATVAFYTAVHLVEKLRAYNGQHSRDHEERNAAVRRDYRAIHTEYHELFNHSLIARYATVGKFYLSVADAKKLLVDTYLTQIEKYVAAESAKLTAPAPAPAPPAPNATRITQPTSTDYTSPRNARCSSDANSSSSRRRDAACFASRARTSATG